MNFHLFLFIFIAIFFTIDCILFFKIKKFSFKGAILNFLFWTLIAIGFFALIYAEFSPIKAKEFLAGYVLERTLSLDNIFVFYVLFGFFKIDEKAKERVLFWGIILAILLRAVFIFIGAALIAKFYFVMYIFALFLILTGIKLLMPAKKEDPSQNKLLKFFKKILPTTEKTDGDKFTLKVDGKMFFTPVFIVMLLVGFTDIIFALDSIPAIFGITLDPFIVVTANFFSLMGLRAIFCLISHIIKHFYYIKYALSVILVFIGIKMMIAKIYHIPILYSLGFILLSIVISIIASMLVKVKKES